MPIYNPGDFILSRYSSSAVSFLETKLSTSPNSVISFDQNSNVTTTLFNSLVAGTSSYVSTTGNAFVQDGNSFGVTAILGTNDGTALTFKTSGTERMRFDTAGNVGIGLSSPTAKLDILGPNGNILLNVGATSYQNTLLVNGYGQIGIGTTPVTGSATLHVNGNISASSFTGSLFGTSSQMSLTGNAFVQGGNSFGTTAILGVNDMYYSLAFKTSGSERMRILTNGNIGMGTQTISANLHVSGANSYPLFRLESATAPNALLVSGSGNVGIGTITPAYKLDVSGSVRFFSSASNYAIRIQNVGSNGRAWDLKSTNSGDTPAGAFGVYDGTSNAYRLLINSGGYVGIGTDSPISMLQVAGTITGVTKDFLIDHPTKPNMKLVYGSLESPYHGIRLTGRNTLINGKCVVDLPNYIYKFVLSVSVNIQLTGIKCNKVLYVDEINIPENYFTVLFDIGADELYKDYDFFWDFTGTRTDVPELETEINC